MSTRTHQLSASGGGAITRSTLDSGVRVLTEQMPGVRSVSVGIWVPVGSRDEAPSLAGSSHFLEHLLFKGTRTRSALDIARAMDAVGGEFNAFTEKEHTCYYATVLDRDLPLALEMLADVVLDATVAAVDVDVERNVVLEEIAMRDDDPADLVHDVFAEDLYGDTPLGRPILGTVDSISGLTRRQIHGYYKRRYRPDQMVVAVAGNVQHRDVLRLTLRAFASADTAGEASPARTPFRRRGWTPVRPNHVVSDDTEQANLLVGCLGVSRHDPARWAVGVLSSALGGGMSSRLFQRVREERGLAYSVYSFSSTYTDAGHFGVYVGCHPSKADEVLGLVFEELDEAAGGALGAEEIERGKGHMRGSMVLALEDCASRMSRLGKSELVYGDVMGIDEVLAHIDAVTVADVAGVAEQILTRPRCLTVVGPYGEHDFDALV